MSGFGGQMIVYRQISIDRFDKKNLKSTVFLLSHCHRDHMVGLDQLAFLRCLQSRSNVFLYCSEVTKLLLLSEDNCKPLKPYIRVLEIGVPATVAIPDTKSEEFQSVVVTALPAGHCPGSVMFLFEGQEGRALYTGDFRWETNFATTLPALCFNGHIKEIDSMYVDTTFCVPEAFHIPSRDACLEATSSLVTGWLAQCPSRYVHVSSNTKYGHEPLLAHLAKEAQTKVHTTKEKVQVYEHITELCGIFTEDPSVRIHACKWMGNEVGKSRLPCGYIHSPRESTTCPDSTNVPEVLVIRPSTMWFTNKPSRLQELVVSPTSGRGLHRVCYSFHSSYSELRDLVSLLRPQQVFPNVLPASDTSWAQVKGRLQKFLTYQHRYHMVPAGDSQTARPLGLLRRKRKSVHSLLDSEGLVFDSPEKPKQPRQDSSCMEKEEEDSTLNSSQKSAASSTVISPTKSNTNSSYQGSDIEDEDMFANSSSDDDEKETSLKVEGDEGECCDSGIAKRHNSQSQRPYVSGDEEVSEDDQASSPQFRRLTSKDDLPDPQPQLCFDSDEGKSPATSDELNDPPEKPASPETGSDSTKHLNKAAFDSGTDAVFEHASNLMEKEPDKLEEEISEVNVNHGTDLVLEYTPNEIAQQKESVGLECHKSGAEMSGKREYSMDNRGLEPAAAGMDENATSSRDHSLQQTMPFSCGIREPAEKNSSKIQDSFGCSETTDSTVDLNRNRDDTHAEKEAENGSKIRSSVADNAQLKKDGSISDVTPLAKHGDSDVLKAETLFSETGNKIVNGNTYGESEKHTSESEAEILDGSASSISHPLFSEDEEDHQGLAEDNKKTQACSLQICHPEGSKKTLVSPLEDGGKTLVSPLDDGGKTLVSPLEDGGKTQVSPLEDGEKTQFSLLEHGKKTQVIPLEDGGKTQVGSSEDGGKTQVGSSEDGGKTQVGPSEDGGKTQVMLLDDGGKTKVGPSEDGGKTQVGPSEDGGKTQVGSLDDGGKTQVGSLDDGGKTEVGSLDEDGKTQVSSLEDGGKTQNKDSKEETNIISSEDSDSDVDCKITKSSFMRKRPINPWQKFYTKNPEHPSPSSVRVLQCKVHSPQRNAAPSAPYPGTRGIHKLNVSKCPNSTRDQSALVSRAGVNGRNPVNVMSMRRTESIDLTEMENDDLIDSGEKETKMEGEGLEQQCVVRVDDFEIANTDTPVGKTGARDTRSADDADIEDSDEESDDEKIKTLPASACGSNDSHSSSESEEKSAVIVIDDSDTRVATNNTRPFKGASPLLNPTDCVNTGTVPYAVHKCVFSAKCIKSTFQNLPHTSVAHKHPQSLTSHSASCSDASPAKRSKSASDSCFDAKQSEKDGEFSPSKKQRLKKDSLKMGLDSDSSCANIDGRKKKECLAQDECERFCVSASKVEPNSEETNSDQEAPQAKADSRENIRDQQAEGGKEETGESKQECNKSEQDDTSFEMKTEERKKSEEEDSDTTIPPDNFDDDSMLPPPVSPVAVHSSDSEPDADCKITQTYIRIPQRQTQPVAACISHQAHLCQCRKSRCQPCPIMEHGHHTHCAALAQSPQFCQVLTHQVGCPQHTASTHGMQQSQRGRREQSQGGGPAPLARQSCVIDLTEDD